MPHEFPVKLSSCECHKSFSRMHDKIKFGNVFNEKLCCDKSDINDGTLLRRVEPNHVASQKIRRIRSNKASFPFIWPFIWLHTWSEIVCVAIVIWLHLVSPVENYSTHNSLNPIIFKKVLKLATSKFTKYNIPESVYNIVLFHGVAISSLEKRGTHLKLWTFVNTSRETGKLTLLLRSHCEGISSSFFRNFQWISMKNGKLRTSVNLRPLKLQHQITQNHG